jgi:putative solute:sodium symporter small subunit
MSSPENSARYWQTNRRLITVGLLLGFAVTFVAAYFARDLNFDFLGWPLSFWIASQGALLVYLLIVGGYAWYMNRLDERESGSREAPRT